MSFDRDALYALLPTIHRLRDAAQGEPLKDLLSVIADQIVILEESLAQAYDDQFVETSAPWVLPYIGDLLGITGLPPIAAKGLGARAEVANTIAYRRRKGTAAVLEQLARDTTGWPARVVEFFQLIATTQHMNHIRLENTSFLSLRDASRLEYLGTAFERLPRSVDIPHMASVRRIPPRDGVPPTPSNMGTMPYGIPNVGVFLWRLRAEPLTQVEAVRLDAQRYRFDPLGVDISLFNRPRTEVELAHLAEPANVPGRISRRQFFHDLENIEDDTASYYGRSLRIATVDSGYTLEPSLVARGEVEACDLSDWSHTPKERVAIDPALGRIKFRDAQSDVVLVWFHRGKIGNIGGGEYTRGASFEKLRGTVVKVGKREEKKTIQAGLDALGTKGGVIQIEDSGRYEESLEILASPYLAIRAADKCMPTIVLKTPLEIHGEDDGEVSLSGLVIAGSALASNDALRTIRLEHCTLVPGIALDEAGSPTRADEPSLVVSTANTHLILDHCIVGAIRIEEHAKVTIKNSIVDATSESGIAYAAPDGQSPGGTLHVENSTVIGKVHAEMIELASNTIFLSSSSEGDGFGAPVKAKRRQEGCVRFSYVPPGSLVPRRHRCQPENDAEKLRPLFDSTRYSEPEYCRLNLKCPDKIRKGADDDAEMGVFHDLYQPQREAHLRARLEEYLRFGLEAGIIYAT